MYWCFKQNVQIYVYMYISKIMYLMYIHYSYDAIYKHVLLKLCKKNMNFFSRALVLLIVLLKQASEKLVEF